MSAPPLDEWNQLTVLPRGRSDFGAGMIDGKIIIVGGISEYTI